MIIKETQNGIKIKHSTKIQGIFYEEKPFKNYFYSDKFPLQDLKNIEFIKIEEEEKYFKIIITDNTKRYLIKWKFDNLNIKTYGADVDCAKRYYLDNPDIKINKNLKKWIMYDIETDDRGDFSKDLRGNVIATNPVLTIAYKDYEGNEFFLYNENKNDLFKGEEEMLKKHLDLIFKYDILLGWNSYKFDDNYIKQRLEFYNLSEDNYKFINCMDYMKMFEKNYKNLKGYSLDNVGESVCGIKKLIQEKGKGKIYESFMNNFEHLKEYNKRDVEIMFELEKKVKFIDLHKQQAEIANCEIQYTLNNNDIIDYLILREFEKQKIKYPSKPTKEEVKKRKTKSIKGGYAFCLKPGFHKNVKVFDFKSFYPTMMASTNLCYTTKVDKDYIGDKTKITAHREGSNDVYFRNDKIGIISKLSEYLINERDKFKYDVKEVNDINDLRQNALKILANSMYGVLSYSYFRFYDFDIANSVTEYCSFIIKQCIIYGEGLGFEIIQGDTDSIIFKEDTNVISIKKLEEKFKDLFNIIADEMNLKKHFDLTNSNHLIVFEFEKTFKTMLSIMMKNYAYLDEKDKIGIVGLECKKRSTNPLAKELQYNLIEKILKEKYKYTDEIEILKQVKVDLSHNKIDTKYLIMTKRLSKPINEFGGIMIDGKTGVQKIKKDGTLRFNSFPEHIKMIKRLNLNIYVGENVEYIIAKNPDLKDKTIYAISLEEYENGDNFDREYYYKRISVPVLKILKVMEENQNG